MRVIYLHGIVFLSVPPQEIWNEAGLTLPGPNKSPRADLMYFDAVCENDTHTQGSDFERDEIKKSERGRKKKSSLMVSVVLCFAPTDVSTSSENFHLEVTCFSNSKLLNGSKWI